MIYHSAQKYDSNTLTALSFSDALLSKHLMNNIIVDVGCSCEVFGISSRDYFTLRERNVYFGYSVWRVSEKTGGMQLTA